MKINLKISEIPENAICKCGNKATDIAYNRRTEKFVLACEDCAISIGMKDLYGHETEYSAQCPNCGCFHGV